MKLNASQLRTAIRSPTQLVHQIQAERRAPTAPDTPRSPQRPMIEAALRVYFGNQRSPDRLLADYDKRTSRAKRRETAASEFANGRRMLAQFAEWDAESRPPLRYLVAAAEARLLSHDVRLGYDVVLQSDGRTVLRQLLTDDAIRRGEHLRMFAAASLLHSDAFALGVADVEIWQLRFDKRFAWPRAMLLRQVPDLEARLSAVARALALDAA